MWYLPNQIQINWWTPDFWTINSSTVWQTTPCYARKPFPNTKIVLSPDLDCQDSTSSCKGVEDSNCGPKACEHKIPTREWIHIPHWGKGKSSSNMPIFWGDMLVSWRVCFFNANEMKVKKTKNHQLASQKKKPYLGQQLHRGPWVF